MTIINNSLIHKLLFAIASLMIFFSITPFQSVSAQGLEIPKEQQNYKCKDGDVDKCVKRNPISKWINFGVNLFSAIILAGASIMMVWAGLQYMNARDNPQGVQAAKEKIWNIVLGLLAYFFLYAFVQWLIPGGVF